MSGIVLESFHNHLQAKKQKENWLCQKEKEKRKNCWVEAELSRGTFRSLDLYEDKFHEMSVVQIKQITVQRTYTIINHKI